MTTESNTPPDVPILFEEFLELLRREGFVITVEHHLRVRALLNRFAAECAPSDLKTLLCPLFATNAEQQELFYRFFDRYYPFFSVNGPRSDGVVRQVPLEITKRRISTKKLALLFAAVGVLCALSVMFLFWNTHSGIFRPHVQSPSPSAAANTAAPQTLTPLPQKWKRSYSVDWKTYKFPHSGSLAFAWYSNQRVAMGWAIGGLPVVFWMFYELYRMQRRRLLIRKQHGKLPPYTWPVQTHAGRTPVYDPYELAQVARVLHRRHHAESERLDMFATVQASIAALGFTTLRFRKDSQLPEYLFLIDRAAFRDHQAQLYETLAAMLGDQGLFVVVYFYEGDPRLCWTGAGDETIKLDLIQKTHVNHRLLLFGDGEQLLDPLSGRLAGWHRMFAAWSDRAVVTPKPWTQWGVAELNLGKQFVVVPATLQGLSALGAWFELPSPSELRSGDESQSISTPTQQLTVEGFRRFLGGDVFQWLCACAVYPELQWDLTLHLGTLSSMPTGLICEENVVRLFTLQWFRSGAIPDELRRELIAQLDPVIQTEVREAIIGLLAQSPAPEGTFAIDARRFQIAYQRYWTNPRDRKVRNELKATLDELSPEDTATEFALLDAVENTTPTPLDIVVPKGLRTILYRRGMPWLGMKTAARFVAAIVLTVVSLQAIRILDRYALTQDHVSKQRMKATDLFYTMKALDVHIAQLEGLALDTGNQRIQEEIRKYENRRKEMEKIYDQFLTTLNVYGPKVTEQERLILRIARVFGECELDMPAAFVPEIENYITQWQATRRLAAAIRLAKENGYPAKISQELLARDLPPQFFYLALQESDFEPYSSGPRTRRGIAKGMWQLIPETAVKYGLRLGPLVDLQRPDSADDRHHWDKETQAAVRYLKDLYSTDAQASSMLAMACYNWGDDYILPLVRVMPANPKERNFWQLLSKYHNKIPVETYNYVFSIVSAAVIGEDPRLFGFDFDNPLVDFGQPSVARPQHKEGPAPPRSAGQDSPRN